MTRKFKIRKNGNINGVCPLTNKTNHYSVCRGCDNLDSMPTMLGKPVGIMICRAGGIEGYTMKKE